MPELSGSFLMNYSDLYAPEKLMTTSCSDGNCLFIKTSEGGMKTNGGCQCEKNLRRTPEGVSAIRTIRILRDRLRMQLMDKPLGTDELVARYDL
jgi:hypothetical protein